MTTTALPTLIFKVVNNALVPVAGQSDILDAAYEDGAMNAKSKRAYNDYVKGLIKSTKEGTILASNNYEFSAKTLLFHFGELHVATKDEMYGMYNNEFDATQNYKGMRETKVNTLSYIMSNVACPTIDDSGFYVDGMNWNYIVRNIMKKRNTMLIGPTGTGKTELIFAIAKRLGMECNTYDMGAMQDPLTDLLGTHRLENGNSVFDTAKFVEDIQKPGIILLDELSRAPQMAMNILFPCLDSRHELRLDIADSKTDRVVKVHPECVFIATANIGAEYAGTNDIDAALLNRFLPLQLDYLPEEIETSVLLKKADISNADAKRIAAMAKDVRNVYKSGELTKSVSTRETCAIAELVEDGFSVETAFKFVVGNKFTEDDEKVVLGSIILGAA